METKEKTKNQMIKIWNGEVLELDTLEINSMELGIYYLSVSKDFTLEELTELLNKQGFIFNLNFYKICFNNQLEEFESGDHENSSNYKDEVGQWGLKSQILNEDFILIDDGYYHGDDDDVIIIYSLFNTNDKKYYDYEEFDLDEIPYIHFQVVNN